MAGVLGAEGFVVARVGGHGEGAGKPARAVDGGGIGEVGRPPAKGRFAPTAHVSVAINDRGRVAATFGVGRHQRDSNRGPVSVIFSSDTGQNRRVGQPPEEP